MEVFILQFSFQWELQVASVWLTSAGVSASARAAESHLVRVKLWFGHGVASPTNSGTSLGDLPFVSATAGVTQFPCCGNHPALAT